MWGMNSELYHGQVVGKISYINRNLEILDKDKNHKDTNIKDDYKDIIAINSEYNTFSSMLEASKAGKLPDWDSLAKRSLVLQEMVRLQSLIEP